MCIGQNVGQLCKLVETTIIKLVYKQNEIYSNSTSLIRCMFVCVCVSWLSLESVFAIKQ